jgi:hypothetical protein
MNNVNRKGIIMIRTFNYATIFVVLSVFLVPWANAADLSADYLYGRWVIDDQNCSSPDAEYMEFNKNGTFEGTRTGKAEIVGFLGAKRWHPGPSHGDLAGLF